MATTASLKKVSRSIAVLAASAVVERYPSLGRRRRRRHLPAHAGQRSDGVCVQRAARFPGQTRPAGRSRLRWSEIGVPTLISLHWGQPGGHTP